MRCLCTFSVRRFNRQALAHLKQRQCSICAVCVEVAFAEETLMASAALTLTVARLQLVARNLYGCI